MLWDLLEHTQLPCISDRHDHDPVYKKDRVTAMFTGLDAEAFGALRELAAHLSTISDSLIRCNNAARSAWAFRAAVGPVDVRQKGGDAGKVFTPHNPPYLSGIFGCERRRARYDQQRYKRSCPIVGREPDISHDEAL